MSGLVLAQAEPSDLDALLAIERASYSHPWTRRNLEGELEAEHGVFLALRVAGAEPAADRGLRAYCAFRVVAGEMHLLNLTVAPGHRRRGLGRFLLRFSLDLATRRGATASLLEVRASNTVALALYGAEGFVETGRRRAYYDRPQEDALLLRRSLPGGCARGGSSEP